MSRHLSILDHHILWNLVAWTNHCLTRSSGQGAQLSSPVMSAAHYEPFITCKNASNCFGCFVLFRQQRHEGAANGTFATVVLKPLVWCDLQIEFGWESAECTQGRIQGLVEGVNPLGPDFNFKIFLARNTILWVRGRPPGIVLCNVRQLWFRTHTYVCTVNDGTIDAMHTSDAYNSSITQVAKIHKNTL